MIRSADLLVIGAGPAGMGAAVSGASLGAEVLLVDRQDRLGGQLIKQTHMFFGSEKEHASIRGIQIAQLLSQEVHSLGIQVLLKTTALGCYPDGIIALERGGGPGEGDELLLIKPGAVVVATGAAEKVLAFPNCDLPGIYGAGAVQTLMNVHGVRPGHQAIMVGAGNIGLIVSYQLLQAGVSVLAVVEAAPTIGGYAVHASKIARLGVPILTSHTVKEAYGEESLKGVITAALDEDWNPIAGSERDYSVDVLCIAVGLTPLTELLWQAGCEMAYIPELGGYVARRDEKLEATVSGFFTAGDAAGIEEASSAMVEGRIAGYYAARALGYEDEKGLVQVEALRKELETLRGGPTGAHIRKGIQRLQGEVEENA